jgi:predicted nucleic acid-binding protein
MEHLKGTTDVVAKVLEDEANTLMSHPLVVAELVLGGVRTDSELAVELSRQLSMRKVSDDELLEFIRRHRVSGRGIGYVDTSLLASCILDGAALVTFDRRLSELAEELGAGY